MGDGKGMKREMMGGQKDLQQQLKLKTVFSISYLAFHPCSIIK